MRLRSHQESSARKRSKARRRQWGSDRRERALPAVSKPATNASLGAARVAILVTVIGWFAFTIATLHRAFRHGAFDIRADLDALLYMVVVTLLTASALAYLVARLGFLYRARLHRRMPRAMIDGSSTPPHPASRRSCRRTARKRSVIRQTLLSTALQEYADLRIVLLIDDPPNPSEPDYRDLLEAARAAARRRSNGCCAVPRRRFERGRSSSRRGWAPARPASRASRSCAPSPRTTTPPPSMSTTWPTAGG